MLIAFYRTLVWVYSKKNEQETHPKVTVTMTMAMKSLYPLPVANRLRQSRVSMYYQKTTMVVTMTMKKTDFEANIPNIHYCSSRTGGKPQGWSIFYENYLSKEKHVFEIPHVTFLPPWYCAWLLLCIHFRLLQSTITEMYDRCMKHNCHGVGSLTIRYGITVNLMVLCVQVNRV